MMRNLPPPYGLTAAQFCAMARASYAAGVDQAGDMRAEYLSEVEAFGDAGPGAYVRLSRLEDTLAGVAARYLQLTGVRLDTACADPYDEPDADAAAAYAEAYRQGLI